MRKAGGSWLESGVNKPVMVDSVKCGSAENKAVESRSPLPRLLRGFRFSQAGGHLDRIEHGGKIPGARERVHERRSEPCPPA